MKSKLLSFKSFAFICVAVVFFMANGFAQNKAKAPNCEPVKVKMVTEEAKEVTPNVIISASNVAPTKQNPDATPVQSLKIDVLDNNFTTSKEVEIKDAETPYFTVAQMPEYIDGKKELHLYVAQAARYPVDALREKAEGIVIIQVIVEKNGSITNPKVISSIHPKLDEEALRVICTLKSFKPGKENGEAVRCYYQIPVPFILPKK